MSIWQLFKRERKQISGLVERVGPWRGPSEIDGIVLLLQGDNQVYLILRDGQNCTYPAGLTTAGDQVQFESDPSGSVGLSTFKNLTLDTRLNDGDNHRLAPADTNMK